jgi:uncharacterized membrane protein YfcA
MTDVIVYLALFIAIFTQSAFGFGLALVAMPILAGLIGIHTTTPLIVLVGVIVEIIVLIRYKNEITLKSVWQIIAASAVGIPFGVYALRALDEQIVLTVMGIFIILYALWALFNLRLPKLERSIWAYGFGFVSGVIGGAYNLMGPLIIVYGNCRNWRPKEFKGNLQGIFLVSSFVAIISHGLAGNFTQEVINLFIFSLPVTGLGILAGLSLDKYMNPILFRKIVLVGLIFAGARLIF